MSALRLPPAMAALRPTLGDLVAGVEARVPYGAALLSAKHGLRISVTDHEQQVIELAPTAGTVVTAFDGATMHEAAIGGFDRAAVERAARALAADLRPAGAYVVDPGPARRQDFITPMQIAPETLSTEEKLERCRELHRRVRGLDQRIVNVEVLYSETSELAAFRNRAADLAQRVQRIRMSVVVAVGGPSGVRYDWLSKDATGGWEQLAFDDDELRRLVDTTVALLSAERIEPGEYTIIASPGVTGTICHESFGHGVETDMFLKERAMAAHFIDRVIGSPLVQIWDDPSSPGTYGAYFFDDEGMLAAPTQIVERGVFRRGITDLYSALALGIPRSANGRRQDFSRKVYARMSTTFFGAGETPVADLFAQVDRGIYLVKWSSGMEDPQGWGIQVTCHYGLEIKGGRLTGRMFAPIGISGYVPDVLQSISAVGDDWATDGGGCGKGHKEWLPVSSGGPHLLLKARLG
ncbi:MAG: TldD/PmbA family protein [Kouleothrix sp.]|nr:TldD/PmbA family protein [Kouleothrix sp.]